MSNSSAKDISPLLSRARIIYLEDHTLFRGPVINKCIKGLFSSADINEFDNGDSAWNYIENEIKNKNKIELVITDIIHPGLQGHELSKRIRFYEEQTKSGYHIPIVILSMVPETNYPELMASKIIDAYLSKAMAEEEIINCLERIIKNAISKNDSKNIS